MKLYQSGVGCLLYLLKHSTPELSNPIRELSKGMHLASKHHMKEMLRIMKWVISYPNIGLKMEPKWAVDNNGDPICELKGICDSTWCTDKSDGKSIIWYIIYFMNVPVAWKSKTQTHVTCSSCEDEYVSGGEMAKEILFIKSVLDTMKTQVKTPNEVYMDNTAAIQLVRNNMKCANTRHVSVKYHLITELQNEWKSIAVQFRNSKENDADLMPKNATMDEFNKHDPKLVKEIPKEMLKKEE